MNTTILWEGIAAKSLERLDFLESADGFKAEGNITGSADDLIFHVHYKVMISKDWKTKAATISGMIGDQPVNFILHSQGDGVWEWNGEAAPQFNGCIDIDISLTPFTNALAVNRLKLNPSERKEITVVYFDLLEGTVRPAHQAYTHLSKGTYKYENIPNDFEAVISLDNEGFVVDYPGLFTKLGIYHS